MRIAQYGIAQEARNSIYRTRRVTQRQRLVEKPSDQALVFSDILKEDKGKPDDIIQLRTRWDLIETLMAILSNQQIRFQNPLKNFQETPTRVVTEVRESIMAQTAMVFTSTGVVHTETGECIDFTYNVTFSKTYLESMSVIHGFNKRLTDPLALNLDNRGLNLSHKEIRMDLDLDGHMETFNMLQEGSGFLVLDRNRNQKVDDGSELFGPQTDNGFAELKIYDQDGNLWIDENDEIYRSLQVWVIDGQGQEHLLDLKEAGIGAIYLDHVESPFDLEEGSSTGRITHSGVYLKENGQVGAVHEIKL